MKHNEFSKSGGNITVVILAAGRASRMGREKLLLMLGEKPVIRHVVQSVRGAGLSDIVVVTNPRNEDLIRQVLDDQNIRIVCNPSYEQGLASSIAAGVAAVSSDAIALLLVQGDQPFVNAEMLRFLVADWRKDKADYVAASYDTVTTTPVLFGRPLFDEMAALEGDVGARSVLRNHNGRVIPFPAWHGIDLDTEDDYRRVLEVWQSTTNALSPGQKGSI
jgi:molybdenum cofactor cytidylyltransferase